jgi:bis(5'-nucleosyl)-tetraphosphatase (symmetrical)
MALYLIGDVQGCDEALGRLLQTLDFSPSRDVAYFLGDLVNRGPSSLGVLQRLMDLGDAARCVLGNHDLHLLAAAHQIRPFSAKETFQDVLNAPTAQRDAVLTWLSQQPLARFEHGVLMVHAGVLPSWDVAKTLSLAQEVQSQLSGPALPAFLSQMYGNLPNAWDDHLTGAERHRVIVNALTRLRFCTPEGEMEFSSTEAAADGPPGFVPWFDAPQRKTEHTTVAFGHWSRLGWMSRPRLISLDTGCVWGGQLSACEISPENPSKRRLIQVECQACQKPGNLN